MTSLPVFTFAYIRWLLSDQPERAAAELERARARLDEPGFVPHRFGVCYGLTDVALYLEDTGRARSAVTQGWSELEAAMALRLQTVRIFMLHVSARVACAEAAGVQDNRRRSQHLGEALANVRKIRKERTDWGNAVADLVEASVAAEEMRLTDSLRLLESAESGCLRNGMDQFLAAARFRKAQLLPGEGRLEAERQAAAWFRAQKVVRPEAIVRLLSPGNWGQTT